VKRIKLKVNDPTHKREGLWSRDHEPVVFQPQFLIPQAGR
jgi:hypothetical protein